MQKSTDSTGDFHGELNLGEQTWKEQKLREQTWGTHPFMKANLKCIEGRERVLVCDNTDINGAKALSGEQIKYALLDDGAIMRY